MSLMRGWGVELVKNSGKLKRKKQASPTGFNHHNTLKCMKCNRFSVWSFDLMNQMVGESMLGEFEKMPSEKNDQFQGLGGVSVICLQRSMREGSQILINSKWDSFIIIFLITMNGKLEQAESKKENELEEQTNERKSFTQDIFNIEYLNTSKIFYRQSEHSIDVKVNNYLCYQDGNFLYKTTEIIYEDKLIRIEDKFEVNIDPKQLKITSTVVPAQKKQKSSIKHPEKVRIFSKDSVKAGASDKKDRKNIVKNIVKIFVTWLEKKSADINCESAYSELKALMQAENFNNRLIKNIVSSQNASKAFYRFLSEDAQDQIKYSRILDKQSHYEAIQLYISLLTESNNRSRQGSSDNMDPSSPSQGDFSQNANTNKYIGDNNKGNSQSRERPPNIDVCRIQKSCS